MAHWGLLCQKQTNYENITYITATKSTDTQHHDTVVSTCNSSPKCDYSQLRH